jgi:hypothetical protein
MSRDTEKSIYNANRGIRQGLLKHQAGKTLTLNGQKWPVAKMIAALDAEDAQFAKTRFARASWLGEVMILRKLIKANHRLRLSMRVFAELTHGAKHTALGDYGFKVRTRKKQTPVTKTLAAAKRRATRAARGTMGPRQRAKIKGVLPTASAPSAK